MRPSSHAALVLAALLLCLAAAASARRSERGGGTCKKGGFERASTYDARVREAASVVAQEAADRLYDGKCTAQGRPSVLRACTKVRARAGCRAAACRACRARARAALAAHRLARAGRPGPPAAPAQPPTTLLPLPVGESAQGRTNGRSGSTTRIQLLADVPLDCGAAGKRTAKVRATVCARQQMGARCVGAVLPSAGCLPRLAALPVSLVPDDPAAAACRPVITCAGAVRLQRRPHGSGGSVGRQELALLLA